MKKIVVLASESFTYYVSNVCVPRVRANADQPSAYNTTKGVQRPQKQKFIRSQILKIDLYYQWMDTLPVCGGIFVSYFTALNPHVEFQSTKLI